MRGQSKALELVIVLFVLVVVAWVIINIFQSLLQEQTQKLENIQSQEELKGKALDALRVCEQRCNTYLKSRSRRDLVEFCSEKIELDINKDGTLGYAEKSAYSGLGLAGLGVCEDSIPCFALVECKIGEKPIDAKDCKEAICSYFSEDIPASDDIRNLRLNDILNPGSCYKSTQPFNWFNLYFNETKGELKCS